MLGAGFLSLLTGMRPVNKELLTITMPVNKELYTGTVPVNNELLTGTVPVNNFYYTELVVILYKIKQISWGFLFQYIPYRYIVYLFVLLRRRKLKCSYL